MKEPDYYNPFNELIGGLMRFALLCRSHEENSSLTDEDIAKLFSDFTGVSYEKSLELLKENKNDC